MKKDQFLGKFQNLKISQAELERKWQSHIREQKELQMMYEAAQRQQSQSSPPGASAGGAPPICPNPFLLADVIDWSTWAPGGSGTAGNNYAEFDTWATEEFPAVTDVGRLLIHASNAYAHVHSDFQVSNLTIDLYDSSRSAWVTVWSYRLENPYYPGDVSNDYLFNGLDIAFPTIAAVTAIRLTSDPGSDQTYHSWDDPVQFGLYQCGSQTATLKLIWDDIANVPVANAESVSDWNDLFGDPVFSAVSVTGSIVSLTPVNTVVFSDNLFSPGKAGNQHLLQIIDNANCVATLGSQSIANCHNLTTVILPACTYIGYAAVENCYNLVNVDFSAVTEVADLGLGELFALTSLDMPALTTAGVDAFYYCDNLVSFSAPNLATIGSNCFAGCSSLTSISLPLITTIGDGTFYQCGDLASVSLPSLVTLGINVFNACNSLTTISLPLLESTGSGCFATCTNLTTVSLPELLTLGEIAFGYSNNLTSLSIPKCTSLGPTVADNNVFYNIGIAPKNNFTLTIDPSRMTCNSSAPDGDIQTLAATIAPSILTVNGVPYP